MTAKKYKKTNEIAEILTSEKFHETAIQINNDFRHLFGTLIEKPKRKTNTSADTRNIGAALKLLSNDNSRPDNEYTQVITSIIQNAEFQRRNYLSDKIIARIFIRLRPQLEESKNCLQEAQASNEVTFLEGTLDLIDQYIKLATKSLSDSENRHTQETPIKPTPSTPRKKSNTEKPHPQTKSTITEPTVETQIYGYWIAIKLEQAGVKYEETIDYLTKNLSMLSKHLGDIDKQKITAKYITNIIKGNILPSENLHKAISFVCKIRNNEYFDEVEFNIAYKNALNSQKSQQKLGRA